MITSLEVTPISPDRYELGEGPLWDSARQRLLWVDILAGQVLAGRLDPFEVTDTWSFDDFATAVAVAADGSLLVAEREILTRVDPDGRRSQVARVLAAGCGSRLNDGAVDPSGRFVVGSMALDDRTGQEVLVRLENGGCTTLDSDLTLSNGLAWTPDGSGLYSIDSVARRVRVRDYPGGDRHDLLEITGGLPDGMCLDSDGNLWIAVHGAGRVECRSPGGTLFGVIELDTPQPTSVAFAGPDLDVLVITTATEGMSAAGLAAHPDSGRIFTARVGATGLPTPYWNPAL
ncbi:SMP-30/gluconolactonase/LRE family protein [Actinoplanes sp. NPDC026619]|uniref:SMP-30/gluconolactonase/LRE family protein n=1 Tax=Actinoplanes sp. NPDC026619 TaxID=3155798 RepID=UPI0033CA3696